ncbi:MAG: hypothetical protein ACOYKR_10170 [Sphingobacterium thalpophilum]
MAFYPKRKPTFETARFHIQTGPGSLFERINFKFKDVSYLKVHATHFIERMIERDAPIKSLIKFEIDTWRLINAEIRTDSGKFVSTAWEIFVNDRYWRVVIGFENTIQTVINIDGYSNSVGSKIITEGNLYDYVRKVNKDLMDSEKLS